MYFETFQLKNKPYIRHAKHIKGHLAVEKNMQGKPMEQDTPNDKSNPAKHLKDHAEHIFTWKVICYALKRQLLRKTLEEY